MFKKIGALALTAAVALCCFSGCKDASEKEIKLVVKVPTLSMVSYCDGDITTAAQFIKKAAKDFEEYYEKEHSGTKVTLDVREFEIAEETKHISETFDTADAPDVLYEGYFNMSTYIYTGRVVPLDDIIDNSLRADVPDDYWKLSQVGGKTYMMPYLSLQNTMSFNREIFKAAGLTEYIGEGKDDIVQTWTLTEWDDILSRLKTYCDKHNAEENAKQIYPMMMYAGSDQGDTHIMTLLRSRGCSFFDSEGNVKVNTEEGIAALKWLQDCANAEFFPKNCAESAINDNTTLFLNGQLAVMMNNASSEAMANLNGIEVNSVNFPCVGNTGLATDFVVGFEVFDNKNAEKVAVSKSFVKYVYDSKYVDYMAGGSMPCRNSISQKFATELKSVKKYIDNANNSSVESWNFTNNSPNWRGVRNVFWGNINDLLAYPQKSATDVAAAIDQKCNAAIAAGFADGKLHD